MIEIKNYIDGLFVAHSSPNSVAVYEPATGKQYATLPDSTSGDVENAYQAAKKAFPKWKNISAEERFKILEKVAHLIEVNHERLAQAESRDTGKRYPIFKNLGHHMVRIWWPGSPNRLEHAEEFYPKQQHG
jgi:aminomuconate-semialdehyde/2-hydroxymuconate-6-semialdehyde dehydrogenase